MSGEPRGSGEDNKRLKTVWKIRVIATEHKCSALSMSIHNKVYVDNEAERRSKMKFIVQESTYIKQGTEKAFAVHDQYNKTYYIPRSQVAVVDTIRPQTKYDMTKLIIEVPNWIIKRNNIPVFNITEMTLDR